MTPTPTTALAALMQAFFDAVSFEPGGRPPYERLHGLFIDGGLLIRNIGPAPEVTGVAQFIAPRQRSVEAGELTAFRETELAEITEVFGQVAHRTSTYAKTGTLNGQAFAARGVISTQFVSTPAGWRISAMAWDDERPGLALPARYAPPAA
jgi:hypothetical protein